MIYVALTILTLYIFVIFSFVIGFDRVRPFKFIKTSPKTTFSVIIPFRNEAENLPKLLKSIENLNYPNELFEIFLVNDESEDNSLEIINRFLVNAKHTINVVNSIRKSNSPKKDAIEMVIKLANNDWIVTTDADCKLPLNWLLFFDNFIQEYPTEFVVAPITYPIENTFLKKFQLLDILSLQGSTIGAFGINKPFLCNGANLCYSKAVFDKVKGFSGNENISSGDDIFLLEKVSKKYPDKTHYLKSNEVIVLTKSQPTLNNLINQRKRWAAKATNYTNSFSKFVGITVFLMNTLLVVLFLSALIGFFNWKFLLAIFIAKLMLDTLLLIKTAYFFKQQKVLSSMLLSSFIYPFFSMYVAIAALQHNFEWKGRTFKK